MRELYEFSYIFSDSFDFSEIMKFAEIFNENFRFITNKDGVETEINISSSNQQNSNRLNGSCNIVDVSGEISIQNKIDLIEKSIFHCQSPVVDKPLLTSFLPNSKPLLYMNSIFQQPDQKPLKSLQMDQSTDFVNKCYSSSIFSPPGVNLDSNSKSKQTESSLEDVNIKDIEQESESTEFCLDMKMVYNLILERCKRVTYAENCRNENCNGPIKLQLKNRDPTAGLDREFLLESSQKQSSTSLATQTIISSYSENNSVLHSVPKREKTEALKTGAPNDINELIEFINSESSQIKKDEQKRKDKKKKKKALTTDTILDKSQSASQEIIREISQSELIKQQSSSIRKPVQVNNSFPNTAISKFVTEEEKEIEAFRASLKLASVHSAFVYKLKTVLNIDTFKYICFINYIFTFIFSFQVLNI